MFIETPTKGGLARFRAWRNARAHKNTTAVSLYGAVCATCVFILFDGAAPHWWFDYPAVFIGASPAIYLVYVEAFRSTPSWEDFESEAQYLENEES